MTPCHTLLAHTQAIEAKEQAVALLDGEQKEQNRQREQNNRQKEQNEQQRVTHVVVGAFKT